MLSCIKSEGREHELLARRININADTYAKLYTKTDELAKFENIDELVKIYNDSLYRKHQNRRLEIMGKNLFVKGYEDDTKEIIQNLISLTEEGVVDYNASVEDWLIENPNVIDSDEKRAILLRMFENSSLAMIYGAAGTGKSTLIKHISQFWNDGSKVYIANTHPAVENLRRRVKDNSSEYLTIELIIELRNYVNSDRINQFSGYFNLSSAIFTTTNKLLQDGRIYTFLSYDSIEKIQENGTYLSVAGENMLSNQIMQHKQVVLNGYMNAKQSASNDIDFWDKTLKKCKENFRDILKELE